MLEHLQKHVSGGGGVHSLGHTGYTLRLPISREKHYKLAQLDDYMHLSRQRFPHIAPIKFCLEAQVSSADLPGTWGFGFWNAPFDFGFNFGGSSKLLPVLPNAAWFFYGSGENYLSLQNDQPAAGFHVKIFKSPLLPSAFSLLVAPVIPFIYWPSAARLLRNLLGRMVHEVAYTVSCDVTAWHHFGLIWEKDRVSFEIDLLDVFQTSISPNGRLGLVIWIDNQFFKFNPSGKIGFGFLPTTHDQWLSIRNLELSAGSF